MKTVKKQGMASHLEEEIKRNDESSGPGETFLFKISELKDAPKQLLHHYIFRPCHFFRLSLLESL